MGRRPSDLMIRILTEMLVADGVELHGYELMRRVGARSGSMYPALRRLQEVGWISSRREEPPEATPYRPPRVYHRLTPDGVVVARDVLAAAEGDISPDPARWVR